MTRRTLKLALLLYPLGLGAAAINLFFLLLIWSWVGWPVLTPAASVAGGAVLGAPMAVTFGRHFDRLMREAEET
jgi:hypothetical protein